MDERWCETCGAFHAWNGSVGCEFEDGAGNPTFYSEDDDCWV